MLQIRNLTTIDVPPSYPTFGMLNAIKPKLSNQTSAILSENRSDETTHLTTSSPMFSHFIYPYPIQTPLSYQQTTSYPYKIQTPPFSYQQTSSQTIPIHKISLNEFFAELDKIHNGNGVYTNLEKFFKQEDITVNAIKDLTDDELIELGVSKIGWRKNIKQAAQKY